MSNDDIRSVLKPILKDLSRRALERTDQSEAIEALLESATGLSALEPHKFPDLFSAASALRGMLKIYSAHIGELAYEIVCDFYGLQGDKITVTTPLALDSCRAFEASLSYRARRRKGYIF